jgi:hypothetical protein
MTFCLGRLPHDPAAVARAPSLARHRLAAMSFPVTLNRSAIDVQLVLAGNADLPTCTAAGLANAARMVAAINGYELEIDDSRVEAFYASCAGVDPTQAAMSATGGVVALDVLVRQATDGADLGGQTPLVGNFGTLPLGKLSIASAMSKMGHAYVGVTLLERDMETASPSSVLDVVDGRDDGAVVGGHLLCPFDYVALADTSQLRSATWAYWQSMTWRWLMARLDEAYALYFRQLVGASGADLGVDPDVLAADLAAMVAA